MTSTDPYDVFNEWCKANGYADVIECEIGETDLDRLDAAIAAYETFGND